MVQVNIKRLIDDVQCYQTVRELRWPDGMTCPSCQSTQVIKRGFDDTEPARQRYECHDCDTRFDDLTDTIFAGHHQPLKVWVLCLYFMGLNIPTISPLIIPLLYVISMASKEHPVWGSHCQEAKRGWPGGPRIPWHGEALGSFLLPCAPPGCPRSREGA